MIRPTKAGTWEVDHYYFDQDGKRRRKLKTFDKYKDAVSYEKEALALVRETGVCSTVQGHGQGESDGLA